MELEFERLFDLDPLPGLPGALIPVPVLVLVLTIVTFVDVVLLPEPVATSSAVLDVAGGTVTASAEAVVELGVVGTEVGVVGTEVGVEVLVDAAVLVDAPDDVLLAMADIRLNGIGGAT